ncbi:putative competence/damage-inducible CinA family protein [Bimuria novae-zelandiae CBS 107.79]|uniref:Putative competence/damage-inducible CinA family protein n=1 Tax=Bimuria novae-zelandiae CBS 107.79 TaxID=1447943 RepID=A0A6A5VSC0_9PLEO|nr:putative competence/damage-inducible CinA family protein [Bimuria novae-zelandiae CBS 107.79]
MASSFPPPELRDIVKEVAELLKERKETISVAETAAGGLISAALLSYPGASGYYKGGVTLYTLESRMAYGGWTKADVERYEGPTVGVVKGLAEHVRGMLGSSYTVSESGTAGPGGGVKGTARYRDPGFVALAVAGEKGTETRELSTGLGGDREANMVKFAVEALKLVRDVIKGEGKL